MENTAPDTSKIFEESLLQQQRAELKREVERGLESGISADFELCCFLVEMNARHAAKLAR